MPAPADPVPKEEEWGSAYDLVAGKRAALDVAEVAALMRAFAYPQTPQQIAGFREEFAYSTGFVRREDFLRIMARVDKEEDLRRQVSRALSLFDGDGNGFITAAVFRRKLATTGDTPLNEKELEMFMAELPITVEGEIPTSELLKVLMAKNGKSTINNV